MQVYNSILSKWFYQRISDLHSNFIKIHPHNSSKNLLVSAQSDVASTKILMHPEQHKLGYCCSKGKTNLRTEKYLLFSLKLKDLEESSMQPKAGSPHYKSRTQAALQGTQAEQGRESLPLTSQLAVQSRWS